MANSTYVTVSIEQGVAGQPRYIHIPTKYANTPGISYLAGEYYTYLTAVQVLQIPGAFRLANTRFKS